MILARLEEIIGPYLNDLSDNEKQTYQALLEHRADIPKLSLTQMAERIYTSKSSLLRLIGLCLMRKGRRLIVTFPRLW